MGNRLNSARTTLLKIPACAMSVIQRPKVWLPLIRRIAPSTAHHNTAMRKFAAGPASATATIARRGLRSALVATGTGFAHPNSSRRRQAGGGNQHGTDGIDVAQRIQTQAS